MLKKEDYLREQMEKEKAEIAEDVATKLEEDEAKFKDVDAEDQKQPAGKLVVAEEKAMGRVQRDALALFFKSFGSPFVWVAVTAIQWSGMILAIVQTWFLGYWSDQYNYHLPSEVPTYRYLPIISRFLWTYS